MKIKIKNRENISQAESMMRKLDHASTYLECYAMFIGDPADDPNEIKNDLFQISKELHEIYLKINKFVGIKG